MYNRIQIWCRHEKTCFSSIGTEHIISEGRQVGMGGGGHTVLECCWVNQLHLQEDNKNWGRKEHEACRKRHQFEIKIVVAFYGGNNGHIIKMRDYKTVKIIV